MTIGQRDWLALAAPLVGLGLLWLLGQVLLSGVALALALTTAMAWGYYWRTGWPDLAVVPVALALALGVAHFLPDTWRLPIALAFVVGGGLLVAWRQQQRQRQLARTAD